MSTEIKLKQTNKTKQNKKKTKKTKRNKKTIDIANKVNGMTHKQSGSQLVSLQRDSLVVGSGSFGLEVGVWIEGGEGLGCLRAAAGGCRFPEYRVDSRFKKHEVILCSWWGWDVAHERNDFGLCLVHVRMWDRGVHTPKLWSSLKQTCSKCILFYNGSQWWNFGGERIRLQKLSAKVGSPF